MNCRNCGVVIDPRRVESGYDYCTAEECQRRCVKRVRLARVGVNKAADQIVRADEVLPPPSHGSFSVSDDGSVVEQSLRPRRSPHRKRSDTAQDKLRRAETRLDSAVSEAYERFCRGEITASQMKIERKRLIRAFNRLVRAENIRYRGLLRREPPE